MGALTLFFVTFGICFSFVFAVIPTFCYLACGNWDNTPWAVLVDYQPRFFTFVGSVYITFVAIDGLIKAKFSS